MQVKFEVFQWTATRSGGRKCFFSSEGEALCAVARWAAEERSDARDAAEHAAHVTDDGR